MLSALQNKSVELLEKVVSTLDSYEELQKRPHVFANEEVKPEEAKDKLKHLSFELIDIGLHAGQKGLAILQKTTPY